MSHLLSHYDIVQEALEQGSKKYIIYLDFSKAYHKVDLSILIEKVKSVGIVINLWTWIGMFISGRT